MMRLSNCCDAQIIYSDICSECKEHCDEVENITEHIEIRRSVGRIGAKPYPDWDIKNKVYVVRVCDAFSI